MCEILGYKKRLFYRLLNNLRTKKQNGEVEIPPHYLSIISTMDKKKSPIKGIY